MIVHNLDPVFLDFGIIQIRWYSLAYIFGILIGWLYGKKIIAKQVTQNNSKIYLSKYDDHINFNVIEEEKPLGTIGVLHQNINYNCDSVLVLNGDLISAIDFEMFYLDFISKDADISILTIPWKVDVPYGIIIITMSNFYKI